MNGISKLSGIRMMAAPLGAAVKFVLGRRCKMMQRKAPNMTYAKRSDDLI